MTHPEPPQGRKKRRQNVIGNSPHREEYVRLMKAGWSSVALERYALVRWGEQIPASTFRSYRSTHKRRWDVSTSTFNAAAEDAANVLDPDVLLDIMHERAELIRLQKARIAIDVKHERQMSKLFNSTAREIELLSRLLDQSKADLQDLGLFPKAGLTVDINAQIGGLQPDLDDPGVRSPQAATLGQVLGMADEASQMQLARALHDVLPQNGHRPANGQVVEGEVDG